MGTRSPFVTRPTSKEYFSFEKEYNEGLVIVTTRQKGNFVKSRPEWEEGPLPENLLRGLTTFILDTEEVDKGVPI